MVLYRDQILTLISLHPKSFIQVGDDPEATAFLEQRESRRRARRTRQKRCSCWLAHAFVPTPFLPPRHALATLAPNQPKQSTTPCNPAHRSGTLSTRPPTVSCALRSPIGSQPLFRRVRAHIILSLPTPGSANADTAGMSLTPDLLLKALLGGINRRYDRKDQRSK